MVWDDGMVVVNVVESVGSRQSESSEAGSKPREFILDDAGLRPSPAGSSSSVLCELLLALIN